MKASFYSWSYFYTPSLTQESSRWDLGSCIPHWVGLEHHQDWGVHTELHDTWVCGLISNNVLRCLGCPVGCHRFCVLGWGCFPNISYWAFSFLGCLSCGDFLLAWEHFARLNLFKNTQAQIIGVITACWELEMVSFFPFCFEPQQNMKCTQARSHTHSLIHIYTHTHAHTTTAKINDPAANLSELLSLKQFQPADEDPK